MGWHSIKSNVSEVNFLLKLDYIEYSQYKTCLWNLLLSWFTVYLLVPLQISHDNTYLAFSLYLGVTPRKQLDIFLGTLLIHIFACL